MTKINRDIPGASYQIPEYVDCEDFTSIGPLDRTCCDFLELPAYLQGADTGLVNEIADLARGGTFPVQPSYGMKKYPPLPINSTGKGIRQFMVTNRFNFRRYNFLYGTSISDTALKDQKIRPLSLAMGPI